MTVLDYLILEFSQEPGYLSLSSSARSRLNISIVKVYLGKLPVATYMRISGYHYMYVRSSGMNRAFWVCFLPIRGFVCMYVRMYVRTWALAIINAKFLLDPHKSSCFGGPFGQLLTEYFLGYDMMVISSFKDLLPSNLGKSVHG